MSHITDGLHRHAISPVGVKAISPVGVKSCLFPQVTEPKLFRHFSTGSDVYKHGAYDYVFKIIMLGDQGVGKTSFMKALRVHPDVTKVDCRCRASPTADHLEVEVVTSSGHTALVRLCDTGGQERYRSLTSSYYRGAHGVLLIFDLNNLKSLENTEIWLSDLDTFSSPSSCTRVLLGSNCASPQRTVTSQYARKYAESRDLPYMEFDTTQFYNVVESLKLVADKITKEVGTSSHNTSTLIRPCSRLEEKDNDGKLFTCIC
ncbi:uncharacterized protein LOC131952871 [Physella acuta]|uniref:uncharacterized protein LOC131952871 n=1 Tax=Physella acuta TaxID=109671 RepID=UPI0027DDB936|nr:uncharacterized protein LOC131952871 [Physella acuta]XP_059171762.1 uncharacterized protein LOC131952871 [Physella acuta]XP_059171763.1 uncharacterized protein LOC131952871 [Physella acuta]